MSEIAPKNQCEAPVLYRRAIAQKDRICLPRAYKAHFILTFPKDREKDRFLALGLSLTRNVWYGPLEQHKLPGVMFWIQLIPAIICETISRNRDSTFYLSTMGFSSRKLSRILFVLNTPNPHLYPPNMEEEGSQYWVLKLSGDYPVLLYQERKR